MDTNWILSYDHFDPETQGLREALCTLGNGVFATRGAFEESRADEVHYPGTYVAGGYNELPSEIAGRTVTNEDLVNFPNWLWLRFRPRGGQWFDVSTMELLEFRQELDLKQGVLRRRVEVCDDDGRVTALESRRIVHMEKHHLAAIQWSLIPQNWSGPIQIESGLDGSVANDGVERYRQLESKHLDVVKSGTVAPEGLYLKVRTNRSDIELAQAARTRIFGADKAPMRHHIDEKHRERIAEQRFIEVRQGQKVVIEKVVAQFTSRDRGIGEVDTSAKLAAGNAPDFDALFEDHVAAWQRLWRRCDVRVELADGLKGPEHDQLVLRLHIFHLLQTASPNTVGRDVGIPARGLHGEAYRGHIFWDELFIFPFYNLRLPSIARSTILYRYYRLDAARKLASQAGCQGACFPWQSGSDGREATQQLHLNPMSGKWDPDYSHLQRHINSAIVYNVWNYFQATGDRSFIEEYGAELILEIARFWSSLAHHNDSSDRFEIHNVMGPDEYHEKYPGADRGGLKNNIYTNVTAVWCLLRAMDILELIDDKRQQELRSQLDIDDAELERWQQITRRMTLVFHDGVLSQFEGYEELDEFDWQGYIEKYDNIERLDRILKAEGDSPNHYKVSKQADVTMLLYLFRPQELIELINGMGYEFGDDDVVRNVEYYRARTSHGSTLSRVVYTSAVHRQDCEAGAQMFLSALESDICDVQGGTTPEGIHLGAMAGTVDIIKRYYAGLELQDERLAFFPHLPHRIQRIEFEIRHRGRWYSVDLNHQDLEISVDTAADEPVTLQVEDTNYILEPGCSLNVDLQHPDEPYAGLADEVEEETELAPPIRLAGEDKRPWPPGECGSQGR